MNKRYVSAGSKHSYTLIFCYSAFTGIFYITREISYSGFVLLPLVVFFVFKYHVYNPGICFPHNGKVSHRFATLIIPHFVPIQGKSGIGLSP